MLAADIMMKLGRNDPCHCGSGKKYKKCHLDSDQRSRFAIQSPESHWDPPSPSPSPQPLPKLLRQLSKTAPVRQRKGFAKLWAETEPIIEYLERQAEIEAAAAELEAHWSEFDQVAADPERLRALARAVFAAECFTPLRFTAADVRRAFDHVGYPGTLAPDEQTTQTLLAAILHVADAPRRGLLSRRLLLLVPEFVAAGRYLEACLVHSAAYETGDHPGESNVFLFHMFAYGYDALAAERQAKDEELLRKLGLDPEQLRSMNLEELDALLQSHAADPAKASLLEAFFRKHPHLRKDSEAKLQAMERQATKLLEREDSRSLQLTGEEVQPWIEMFNERLRQSGGFSETPDAGASKEESRKLFEELVLPLMREMAEAIFTRDRIQQLVVGLKKYRSELFAAGDKDEAGLAMGAINYLEREDSPGLNTFLLSLCWRSLASAIKTRSAATGVAAG